MKDQLYSNDDKEILSKKKNDDSAIVSPELEKISSAPVFAFVLPAFNEEENIETMAKRLVRVGIRSRLSGSTMEARIKRERSWIRFRGKIRGSG